MKRKPLADDPYRKAVEHRLQIDRAKDAVVEAAKAWDGYWRDSRDKSAWPAENTDLADAVAKLEALEKND